MDLIPDWASTKPDTLNWIKSRRAVMAGVKRHPSGCVHSGAVLSQRPPLGFKRCIKHEPAITPGIVMDELKQSGIRPHRPTLSATTNAASGKASSAVAKLQ